MYLWKLERGRVIMKRTLMNPVLNKEFKLRFRSFKSFLGVLFYVFAIGIIVLGIIFIGQLSSMGGVNQEKIVG